MHQHVICMIWANDKVDMMIVSFVLVPMMNFSAIRQLFT